MKKKNHFLKQLIKKNQGLQRMCCLVMLGLCDEEQRGKEKKRHFLFYIQVDCLTSQRRHILVCTIEIKIPV